MLIPCKIKINGLHNMKNTKLRYSSTFIGLLILICAFFYWNVVTGSADITVSDILSVLKGESSTVNYNIIMNIRLPRIVAAILLGGALALSGYLMQTFFNNPIVGPFILGVSSGAKLMVALAMIIMLSYGINLGSWGMVVAAFVGAMMSMGFVLLISLKVRSMSVLVVCGIMIGYICSAITDFVVTFADDSNIVNLHYWSMGSLSGINWTDIKVMAVLTVICFIVVFCLSKPIGAYRLGEVYASNMGVNIKALRVALIVLSSLLAACVTAFAGPVSFVGIAVPHLMKMCLKTTKPIVMIPASFLGGAAVTLLCDGIARMVFAPVELSISSVTAVLLVPVVITMMLKRSGRE